MRIHFLFIFLKFKNMTDHLSDVHKLKARKILEFQLALRRGSFQSFLALGKTWVDISIIYLADALPGPFALCK